MHACACSREISSDGDDGWDFWRNVSETGRLARVFSRVESGMKGRVVKVWKESEAGGADTRKSGVAEMGKREETREEKRRGRGLPATQAHQ